jgi:hypothetical protein
MPGFDRQLARYPQLYSRVGFAHQYRPLDPEDISPVLAHYWQQLGLAFPDDADGAANAITRTTGGNFRLIERLVSRLHACWTSTNSTSPPPRSSTPPDRHSSSAPSSAKQIDQIVPDNSTIHSSPPTTTERTRHPPPHPGTGASPCHLTDPNITPYQLFSPTPAH